MVIGTVYLENNSLTGTIPSQMGNLRDLGKSSTNHDVNVYDDSHKVLTMSASESLRLGYNNLNGPIPSELGNIGGLGKFHWLGNPPPSTDTELIPVFNGTVELILVGNSLSGTLPSEVCAILSLNQIVLTTSALDSVSCGTCQKCV